METGKIEYTRQWCKYEFSRDEMHEIAETLAIKTQELEQIESDKKAVVSRYKERSRINAARNLRRAWSVREFTRTTARSTN
jgi:energy-converting hydrogenase A subunit M